MPPDRNPNVAAAPFPFAAAAALPRMEESIAEAGDTHRLSFPGDVLRPSPPLPPTPPGAG